MEYWPDYSDSFLPGTAHPDITDRFGRVWVWKHSDIYTHDDAIALTEDLLLTGYARMSLPHRKLRDNPNYAGLCGICKSEW